MRAFQILLLCVLATGLVGCGEPPPLQLSPGPTADWPAYGGGPGGGHYTPLEEITPENVDRLEVAWVHRSGDYREGIDALREGKAAGKPGSSLQVTPIVVEGTLYYCTPFNRVFALDPETGEERWMFDPGPDLDELSYVQCRGVSSWRDSTAATGKCSHRIITGTLDARIIALDGATGEPCSEFGEGGQIDLRAGLTEHEASEYGVTSPPAILGDLLITGAFVADAQRKDVPSGVVRAYDVRTGEFRWGWNSVAPNRSPINEKGEYVPGTTNVWSLISVDPERNLVLVPTGNSSPDYYGGERGGLANGLDYYSSSVVALDGSTGEVRWHYQTVHHDIWDYDVPSQPTLVDLPLNGRTRPAVVQVTKMSMTFVLDRETGEPLFPVEERPVPQDGAVPGEYLSPTQPFTSAPPPLHPLGIAPDDAWGFTFFDRRACRAKLEEHRTGPLYTPIALEGTAMYPAILGGNNWGSPAVDPERLLMVANTARIPMVLTLIPQADCQGRDDIVFPQQGSPYCVHVEYLVSPLGAPCSAPPWGTLSAVDLKTAEIRWQVPFGTLRGLAPWPVSRMRGAPSIGGPIVTASGLVFIAAATDRYMRAFDVENGEELWSHRLPTAGNATPMSYRVRSDGRQYVVIAAGGHSSALNPFGDHLVAFSLPQVD